MPLAACTSRLATGESFADCRLHTEGQLPKDATGNGQSTGNKGVELMGRYEVQVLASKYTPHPPEQPLTLQDHSQPVRYRNIWIRKLNQPLP